MDRLEIIQKLKEFFVIEELVSEEVYNAYGNDSWAVFQKDTLHCLLIMREGIDKPFTINTWLWGGSFGERGFRENICDISKKKTEKGKLYTSGHVLGCAFDFTAKGMSSDDVRQWIVSNAELFPCKVRLENKMNGESISWVHFDNKFYERHPKVYLFNV